MKSKVHIMNHPVHLMLNKFPVAYYVAALVCYIVYAAHADPFWFKMGFCANVAGVVMAISAAVPGFLDYYFKVPGKTPVNKIALYHMAANILALIFFAINIGIQYQKWDDPQPTVSAAIYLSVFGVIATGIAAYWGWTLVEKYYVGIDIPPIVDVSPVSAEPITKRAGSDY